MENIDYKALYEEARERAKQVKLTDTKENVAAAEYIFPDLKESEDERIRKEIIAFIEWSLERGSITTEQRIASQSWFAYLEKQKEQKKPTLDNPDLYGDWDKDLLEEIHSWLGHLDGKYTPYTIDDIKLTARHFVEWQKQKKPKPASGIYWHAIKKGERLPCRAYIWDHNFEKYYDFWEGRLIPNLENISIGRDTWYLPADDVRDLPREGVDELLKGHNSAWSEEDENALKYLHELISFGFSEKFFDAQTAADMREWLNNRLKSLRPQPHWKPSEEQMKALKEVIPGLLYPIDTEPPVNHLKDLYEQLKKL